jgi:hypothetical protein
MMVPTQGQAIFSSSPCSDRLSGACSHLSIKTSETGFLGADPLLRAPVAPSVYYNRSRLRKSSPTRRQIDPLPDFVVIINRTIYSFLYSVLYKQCTMIWHLGCNMFAIYTMLLSSPHFVHKNMPYLT